MERCRSVIRSKLGCAVGEQFVVMWQRRQEFHLAIGMIYAAAVMPKTVGHEKVRHLEHGIVTPCLLERSLGDGDRRRFAFHQPQWRTIGPMQDDIRTLGKPVQMQ